MPLPFTKDISSAHLRGSDSITFDPLGVAAVLANPRADLSAARLYVQSDRQAFRWPHTTQIGGALPPIATLVSHLADYDSIHPAVTMCTRDEKSIAIISDTFIKSLRINVSNLWLRDVLNFKPSKAPLHTLPTNPSSSSPSPPQTGRAVNDFAIANVRHVFDQSAFPPSHRHAFPIRWRKALIALTGALTGLLLTAGTVFSILTGDIWGIVLFAIYLFHWLASTSIATTALVNPTCPPIRDDATIKFLVHERPADIGGTVVFKGTQHEMEAWARTTLQFRRDFLAHALHWSWITTGTLSAVASVACMVNMTGRFQLAFLGTLVYSSLAELWLTQAARYIQREVRDAAGLGKIEILTESKSRTEAILRATLAVSPECSLAGLDWLGLKLLPPKNVVFARFVVLLRRLVEEGGADLEQILREFRAECVAPENKLKEKDVELVDRIVGEAREVMAKGGEEKERDNVTTTEVLGGGKGPDGV